MTKEPIPQLNIKRIAIWHNCPQDPRAHTEFYEGKFSEEELQNLKTDPFVGVYCEKCEEELVRIEVDKGLNDSELLDYLDSLTGSYTGRVILRDSTTGRGWRLHETNAELGTLIDENGKHRSFSKVRDAIKAYKRFKEVNSDDPNNA